MQIYSCTNFEGHWPVPVAAIVVAQDKGHARRLLARELQQRELGKDDPMDWLFEPLETSTIGVHIISDGNY